MGMDFTASIFKRRFDLNGEIYEADEIAYMRKAEHFAVCCYVVANGVDKELYDVGLDMPTFTAPFTKDQLIEVLRIALEIEKERDVMWSYDNTKRDEYIEIFEKLIADTSDKWVLISW